jgi:glycolate oxidase iron-sulfur subunit
MPHCPTYGRTRDEGDSPRGRIALMQALAEGRLAPGGRLDFHLDRCLACRACERVCPSQVRYGQLIDAARAYGAPRRRPGRLARWLQDGVIPDRRRLGRIARLLRLYQRSGLRRVARLSGLLRLTGTRRLDVLLPEIPPVPRWRPYYPPVEPRHGDVALFTGCIGSVLDRDALEAAITLVNACGYGVHVPEDQTCCGALHLHGGDPGQAAALARRNLDAFDALRGDDNGKAAGIDAVLYSASGCGATLVEYGTWPAVAGIASPGRFTAPVLDVCSFLERSGGLARLSFAPLNAPVAVHAPCTLRNVVRAAEVPDRLLGRIPGLTVLPLPANGRCCGAAGSYLLTQPAMADALRDDTIRTFRESGAEILLSSNIGCALQLSAGLLDEGARGAQPRIVVLHPVTLLARQLRDNRPSLS